MSLYQIISSFYFIEKFLIKCLALYNSFILTIFELLRTCILFVMLDSVFPLLSLQHVLCICPYLICFLTKLHCATYIS
jgi:hypothetical protein